MYAVIMAGGDGTRLRPLTYFLPKAMVKTNGVPTVERQILQLKDAGVTDIVICEGGMKYGIIQMYLGNGHRFGIQVTHLVDSQPQIGSAGALKDALSYIRERDKKTQDLIVQYGDILAPEVNFRGFIRLHRKKQSTVTMLGVEDQLPFAEIECEEDGRVVSMQEKPKKLKNGAIFVVSTKVYDYLPDIGDFSAEVLEPAVSESKFPVYQFKHEGLWWDIGTPQVHQEVDLYFRGKER